MVNYSPVKTVVNPPPNIELANIIIVCQKIVPVHFTLYVQYNDLNGLLVGFI
jgi:hypothetical protein